MDEVVDVEVPLDVQGFLVVPEGADRSTDVEDAYGVVLENRMRTVVMRIWTIQRGNSQV